MKIDFLKIKSAFPPPEGDTLGFDSYITSIESLVKKMISESTFEIEDLSHSASTEAYFQKLKATLPLVTISSAEEAPCTLSVAILCNGNHSHGIGRFFCDRISSYLIPGKHLAVTVMRSLSFKFVISPDSNYFITQLYIEVSNSRDLKIIQENFPRLSEELRLTTLGVEHARKIALAKGMSIAEKGMVLLENLYALIHRPSSELRHTIFGETQHLLLKIMQEKDPKKIPSHLLPILEAKPQVFDSTIYNELQHYLAIFDSSFSNSRPLAHLNKLLSYLYLFRKIVTHSILIQPNGRHTSFKLLKTEVKTSDGTQPVLACLIGVNLVTDHEILEEFSIFQAIQEELPHVELVDESLIMKKEEKKRVRMLYLEVKRQDREPFTSEEIKRLKKTIPKKIKGCIQKTSSPPPSLYSEEETMRNILTLSKELKYPSDLPQVVIQFHNQNKDSLHFSVILVRIEPPGMEHLTLTHTPKIHVEKMERKVSGILNKRYVKEAYVFDVFIKEQLTIEEGRQKLLHFLKDNLHEVCDFNGGMITRQYETLAAFKKLLSDPLHDPLIENYFYSITPSYMQSLIPPSILKEHFTLLLKTLDNNYLFEEGYVVSKTHGNYALFVVSSTEADLIEHIKQMANPFVSNPDELLSTYIKVFDLHCIGFLSPQEEIEEDFRTYLERGIQEYKTKSPLQLTH